jgi:hypothetical protein
VEADPTSKFAKIRLGKELHLDHSSILKGSIFLVLSIELFILLSDIFLNHLKWIPYSPLRRVFNITREDGLSNWFSSTQALFAGLIALALAYLYFSARSRLNLKALGWGFVASAFLYIAVDDATKFHERLGSSLKKATKTNSLQIASAEMSAGLERFPSYSWQFFLAPIFFLLGSLVVFFLWREVASVGPRLFLVAGVGFFILAVGLDFVEGLKSQSYLPVSEFLGLEVKAVRHLSKAIEEFLEMLGTSCFLLVFLDQFLMQLKLWRVRWN